jgi:hypothetical protein
LPRHEPGRKRYPWTDHLPPVGRGSGTLGASVLGARVRLQGAQGRLRSYRLQYASGELMGDRVVAREAVKWQGCALEYASKELKGDRAVIRICTPPRAHGRQCCRNGGCQAAGLCARVRLQAAQGQQTVAQPGAAPWGAAAPQPGAGAQPGAAPWGAAQPQPGAVAHSRALWRSRALRRGAPPRHSRSLWRSLYLGTGGR